MGENKKPMIRFKGFHDAWEQRKLRELCNEFRSGEFIKASDIAPLGEYPVYGGNGLRGYTSTYNHDGEFALIGRQGALCGNMQFSCGRAYFTEHAVAVRGNYENETRFLYHLFGKMNLGQYSGQSAQPGLAVGNLIELITLVPIKAEQTKIYALFDSLDNLITLHQRKYDKLQNVKKSMLEKMFPKNESNVPEIRFMGFHDAWEQRKLGDLATSTYGGGTPTTSNPDYWDGNIPWIQSSDLSENRVSGVVPRKYISEDGLRSSATKLVPPNSIAIITRVGVGKLAVMPFLYTTSQDFLSLSNLKTDVWFSVYAIYKKLHGELYAVQGTSIKGITKEELLSKIILIPKTEEQLQIGQFFQNLDNLITLHQRKLERFQNIKKSCLERMFV